MTDHSHPATPAVPPVMLSISRKVVLTLSTGAIAGVVLSFAGAGLYSGGMRRMLLAYLVAFAFVLSLSLGSLFFVLIQHLMRASWSVLVRRPAEIFSLNILTVAVLFLPIAWSVSNGSGDLYPWAQQEPVSDEPHATADPHASADSPIPEVPVELVALKADHANDAAHTSEPGEVAHDPHADLHGSLYVHQTLDDLTRSKQSWLNPVFFLLRAIFFFAVWILISAFYFRRSRCQDTASGDRDTRQMEWWAGICTFAFALTLTYASFDLLMSLDPHWYSTIFGVYYFSGCAVGGLSLILLSILIHQRLSTTTSLISAEHRRDLGRLLFAFVMFWCYIAFSQYMLLWYANVPETTRWLVVRGASLAEGYTNSWGLLLLLLLIGHFFLPFFGTMSRHMKGNPRVMVYWTVWLLVMHYLDLYWLVMPELGPHFTIGLPEIGTLLFVGCTYLLGASYIATRTSLVPVRDPRLKASIAITDAY